ncbi:hypothetical protein FEM48_Zijuj12G0069700 [Ziziphus jujuba var. spinosa]|uniref:Uncharacterized protein n=1 Tax=Ziziphus jujuba var. spinosa TaxID=714518 RepID=A0A978UBV0_ZIZJJ|nr:hypothetical protein FEM48_Zijuj12G0069700 [Ziziphus jujuba var. spinosa]
MASLWKKESINLSKFLSNILPVVLVGGLATAILLSFVSFSNYLDSKSGPQTEPLFLHLDSFSVSNFKVSNSSFSAQWDAKLTFKNRNGGLKIVLYAFHISVCYNEGGDVPLSCAFVDEIQIYPKKEQTVEIRFDRTTSGSLSCGDHDHEKGFMEGQMMKKLNEDVKSGDLNLSLRMETNAFYGIRLLGFGTTLVLTPNCQDLNVKFLGQSGRSVGWPLIMGRWKGGGLRIEVQYPFENRAVCQDCDIYLLDRAVDAHTGSELFKVCRHYHIHGEANVENNSVVQLKSEKGIPKLINEEEKESGRVLKPPLDDACDMLRVLITLDSNSHKTFSTEYYKSSQFPF